MSQAVEECCRHLGITEHRRLFAESEVRRDNDRGALVEPADQVEQELTTGLSEWQIIELVEDDEVETKLPQSPKADVPGLCEAFNRSPWPKYSDRLDDFK